MKHAFWRCVRRGCVIGFGCGVGILLLLSFLGTYELLKRDELLEMVIALFVVPITGLFLWGWVGNAEQEDPASLVVLQGLCGSLLYTVMIFGGLCFFAPHIVGI